MFGRKEQRATDWHEHDHRHDAHAHVHGAVDPAVFTSERGIWAVKWSFLGLFATAVLQLMVVLASGSVALLADTIHNVGDAATSIPLWIAFRLGRLRPSGRFTYGYGRLEDLGGVIIIVIILASAAVTGFEALQRFLHPRAVSHLWAVGVAAVVGFCGNEAVARFRIRVGTEIGSAALIADGHHARTDALTSLSVLLGAVGVRLGCPLADPAVGALICLAILRIVWQSGKTVFIRLLDGVDPHIADEMRQVVGAQSQVVDITEVRLRWLGHRLHAELNIAVDPELTVRCAHAVAVEVRHRLLHHLRYLSEATIHVDPADQSGEGHHRITGHSHGSLPPHSH